MQHCEMKKQGEQTYKFLAVDNAMDLLNENEVVSPDDIKIKDLFKQVLIGNDKEVENKLDIEIKNLKNATSSAYFKVDENMKRMQQMTKAMGQSNFQMPIKKTLVINPQNQLIKNAIKIWEKGEKKELAEKIVHYVQDMAMISSEGLTSEEKQKFVSRSQNLVQDLSQYIL
jgi:molecular chaperone HtpG